MPNHTLKLIEGTNKCSVCNHTDKSHGSCECCNSFDTLVKFKTILMCQDCYHKELHLTQISEAGAEDRVIQLNDVIRQTKIIDAGIQVRSDLFNAATIAINDIKAAIDNDPNITNKPYVLAETLKKRFNHYKQVVFELNEKAIEAGNHQKAIQIYLNQLANQLRVEEREKLKIQDINYKPNPIKVASPKPIKTRTTANKIDKVELRKAAAELGVNEFTLQMVVISKGIPINEAVKIIKASIEAGKATAAGTN